MAILKTLKTTNFVVISNDIAQSRLVSYEAKGVLVELLSRPPDWKVQKTHFITDACGKEKINRIFKELQNAGYLYVACNRNNGKFQERFWIVSDTKKSVDEFIEIEKYCCKSDVSLEVSADEPDSGKTCVRQNLIQANPPLQIKIHTNKDSDIQNKENHTLSSSQETNIDDGGALFKKSDRGSQAWLEFCSKPISPSDSKALHYAATEILDYLNKTCGYRYRAIDTNLKLIIARLQSKVSVDDCFQVIKNKRKEWEDKPEMAKYLRPLTLFNKTKFEQYLGEICD